MKKLILSLTIIGAVATSLFAVGSAEDIIAKNGCMSCHNIMGMKAAPPFAGIAWRHSRTGGNAKQSLKNSIKNGSQGKYPMFSNTKMPAFKQLSDAELEVLATWVMSQSQNMNMNNGNMMGRCGMMGKCGTW